ncbi:MAG: signal peptidase I [Alphaproteobacteria bacterium GM7ARS4]|nr:signal peptidase I [Alphaproteobacteria bacterium GM7ARS4]
MASPPRDYQPVWRFLSTLYALVREPMRIFVFALLTALAIRSFLFEPFTIPSTSMVPSLLVGDYIFVSKYAYGYSRYSLPFSPPLFSGRIGQDATPERGDVIVFRNPKQQDKDYVKRLIGLPGDFVQMKKGLLYINDQPIQRHYIGEVHGSDYVGLHYDVYHHYEETMPNAVSYKTLERNNRSAFDDTARIKVPEDHYFFMGDNRDDSSDSRDIVHVGFVHKKYLIGRLDMVFFSRIPRTQEEPFNLWRWLTAYRQERFFMSPR